MDYLKESVRLELQHWYAGDTVDGKKFCSTWECIKFPANNGDIYLINWWVRLATPDFWTINSMFRDVPGISCDISSLRVTTRHLFLLEGIYINLPIYRATFQGRKPLGLKYLRHDQSREWFPVPVGNSIVNDLYRFLMNMCFFSSERWWKEGWKLQQQLWYLSRLSFNIMQHDA